MRSFLVGLYAGFLLAALRAPLGLELLQVVARDPGAAMGYRGAALLAVAVGALIGLAPAAKGYSSTTLLAGVTVGFGVHGTYGDLPAELSVGLAFGVLLVLVIAASHRGGTETRPKKSRLLLAALSAGMGWGLMEYGAPASHAAAVLTAVTGCASVALVGRLAAPQQEQRENDSATGKTQGGRSAALVVSGAGLAILCEGVARPLRQLGAGQASDEFVLALVFLFLATFGALAFGRLFEKTKRVEIGRALLCMASPLAALAATGVLENISSVRGIDRLVRSFGLDLSQRGMASYDAAIAAPALVAPAFVVGTIVALARKPRDLVSLCLGAGAGLVLVPNQLAYDGNSLSVELAAGWAQQHSAALAWMGAGTAALGAGLCAALSSALAPRLRLSLGLAGTLVACAAWFTAGESRGLEFSRPWELRPPEVVLHIDAPEGVLTLERTGAGLVACLNGQALAPPAGESALDGERLRQAWSLMPEGARDPRVLLIGQLNAARTRVLENLGAHSVDRSAAWYRAMAFFEGELGDGGAPAFAGQILSPAKARAKLGAGEYDLVLVPPVPGEVPTTRNLASPPETTVVVWLMAAGGLEELELGREILVSSPKLHELCVGLARGPGLAAARARESFGALRFYAAGDARRNPATLATLRTRVTARERQNRAAMARRLAQAELAPGLASGLALHFEAQQHDSPFDTWQDAIEIDSRAAELFAHAASGRAPDALAVEVIESLARILRGKRRIDAIYQSFEAAATRHSPWPELDLALAQADLELLDPAGALDRLMALLDTWPGSAEAWAMRAEAEQQLGQDEAAVLSLDQALARSPAYHPLERRLAIALVRAGDPRGPAALEEVTREDPEDEELAAYRFGGPWEPVKPGYHPLGTHSHGH